MKLAAKTRLRLICRECREHFSTDFGEMTIMKYRFVIQFGGDQSAARAKDAYNLRNRVVDLWYEHQYAVGANQIEGPIREPELRGKSASTASWPPTSSANGQTWTQKCKASA